MIWIIMRVAFRELKGALTRSLLTMLGVVIGVAAVVAMVSMGEGAKQSVIRNIQNLGTNLLIIRPGLLEQRHVRRAPAETLLMDDAALIKRYVPHAVAIAPSSSKQAQVKFGSQNTSTSIIGVSPEYLFVRSFSVEEGRFFNTADISGARRVVALGTEVVKKLFAGKDPLGRYVKINNINFLVVAVLAEKGEVGWWNADDQALVPITSFQQRLFGGKHLQEISIALDSEDALDYGKEMVINILRKSHKIRKGAEDDFHVRTQLEILKSMEEITRTMTLLLGGIAAISLLVGGIGIMNIMLVTVTERTKEIGLRKALGARRMDIMKQFLVESAVLSSVGGVIGILLGAVAAFAIASFTEWKTFVSPKSVITAYSVALFVGVFFGWYPAWKAAKLNPVDALRRE
ncbi:MAG: ABC transporter permease [Nitrospinae bacterium]|nr:ABC transporter permease [Nitrospinota bacterium]